MIATPRPPGPGLTSVAALVRDPLEALPRLVAACGDVWRVDLLFLPVVVLSNPRDVQQVLVKDHRNFRKDYLTRQLRDVLGDGLLTTEGALWRRHRRLAQPAFHGRAVRSYASTMVAQAEAMADAWGERSEVELHAEMMRLTLRIVARTLFGHDIGGAEDRVGRALDVFMEVYLGIGGSGIKLPQWVPSPANLRAARASAELDEVFYSILEEHRRGQRDPDTLLGMLLASTDGGEGLSDQELRDESLTLLMAGHETTALALTMAFYLLSQHPGAEERLHAELDAIEGPLQPDRLPYTRAVVLEAMRLYPPAWSIAREALVDVEIAGYPIEAGTQVWMSQWVLHRDARWFDDPLAFRPERWLDGPPPPDGSYLPFGAGPRICIGKRFAEMEMILVLATLARRMSLRLQPGTRLDLSPSVTLRPRGGLPMVASARAVPASAQVVLA